MGFSDSQMRALARSVPARHVKSRVRDGKELSYVEGWYVLAQANRIFGFDGWDRETIETKCLLGREARGSFTAVYSARVRITVRTPGGTVIRDGHGTGEAQGSTGVRFMIAPSRRPRPTPPSGHLPPSAKPSASRSMPAAAQLCRHPHAVLASTA